MMILYRFCTQDLIIIFLINKIVMTSTYIIVLMSQCIRNLHTILVLFYLLFYNV